MKIRTVTTILLFFIPAGVVGLLVEIIRQLVSGGDIAGLVTPTAILVGGFVATLAYRWQSGSAESALYLKESLSMIDKAHNMLSESRSEDGNPSNDRYLWASAARLISTAQELSRRITEKEHKDAYVAWEFYERWRFHELLRIEEGSFPGSFYAESPKAFFAWAPDERAPISESALRCLYDFTMNWPEGMDDPLSFRSFREEEIDKMLRVGPEHLGAFLREAREHAKRPKI